MFDPHASVFDPQDERLRRARLDDWHHPLQAPTLPVCHVANLLGEVHLVDSQGQRVCSACALKLQTQPVAVPACRTRILRGNLGVWSHAKRFFNLWQVTPALTITARRFQLADNGGKDSLIVLPLLEDAHRLDELLRIDATARACIVQPEADVLFRMCSRVKTVCLCANFARAKDKGCLIHYPKAAGRPMAPPSQAPSASSFGLALTPPASMDPDEPIPMPLPLPVASSIPIPIPAPGPLPMAPPMPAPAVARRTGREAAGEVGSSVRGQGGQGLFAGTDDLRSVKVLRDICDSFPLGLDTLKLVAPRIFRYTMDVQERQHIGLIAQELPPTFADYCRSRVRPSSVHLSRLVINPEAGPEHATRVEARPHESTSSESTSVASRARQGGPDGHVAGSSVDGRWPRPLQMAFAGEATDEQCQRNDPGGDYLYVLDLSSLPFLQLNALKQQDNTLRLHDGLVHALRARLTALRSRCSSPTQRRRKSPASSPSGALNRHGCGMLGQAQIIHCLSWILLVLGLIFAAAVFYPSVEGPRIMQVAEHKCTSKCTF